MANQTIHNNADLRQEMKKRKVTFWRIADAMGVHENTIARRFRHELAGDEKAEMMKVIKSITV